MINNNKKFKFIKIQMTDLEPLLKQEKFKAGKHRHIGSLSILVDLIHQIKYGKIFQKLAGLLLIFCCLLILGLKSLAVCYLWTATTEKSSFIPTLIMIGSFIIKEILRFYEIEVIYLEQFYSLHFYAIAIFDWLQIYIFHNIIVLGAIIYMRSDPLMILVFTLFITELEHFFVQKYFSHETDILGQGDNPRFVKRSLLPTPYIIVPFIIHYLWLLTLIVFGIILTISYH